MTDARPRVPLGLLLSTGDDLLDFWQYRAYFETVEGATYTEHHELFSDSSRRIRNQLEIKRWKRGREIGRGGFGTVYLEEEDKEEGQLRAVKIVQRRTDKQKVIEYLREVLAMANLSRHNGCFVQLYGWFADELNIYIAMEYVPHGDLQHCVQQALPEEEVRTITVQVLEALQVLHARDWAHRDLKPSNVFVIETGPSWWVKLGDLGVSKRVRDDMTQYQTSIRNNFEAPEMIGIPGVGDDGHYTNAVDIWALGYLMHWMLTLKLPFSDESPVSSNKGLISYCMREPTPPLPRQHLAQRSISDNAIEFLAMLLRIQPKSRPTASQMLAQSWLSKSHAQTASDKNDASKKGVAMREARISETTRAAVVHANCNAEVSSVMPIDDDDEKEVYEEVNGDNSKAGPTAIAAVEESVLVAVPLDSPQREIADTTRHGEKEDNVINVQSDHGTAALSTSEDAGAVSSPLQQGKPSNPVTNTATEKSISQIEKHVTNVLVATKQLLEILTQWSRKQVQENEVSDVYVRLGYEFNLTCRAFNSIGVDTGDLGPVPDLLRSILEDTLSQPASTKALENYLPRIRDIVINLLNGLKRKQSRLRSLPSKDGASNKLGPPGKTGSTPRLPSRSMTTYPRTNDRRPWRERRRTDDGSGYDAEVESGDDSLGSPGPADPIFGNYQDVRSSTKGSTTSFLPESFNLPKPKDDAVIEQLFLELMDKRGWNGLPEQARRQMFAYPPAKKWTLVYQDKLSDWQKEQKQQHTRQTDGNQESQLSYTGKTDKEGSPEWYVKKILEDTITTKQLQSLSVSLRTQPIRWVRDFLECEGQVALTNVLLKINRRKANGSPLASGIMSDQELDMEYDIIKCLKALMNNKYGVDDALAHQLVPVALTMCLISPRITTRKLVSEVLCFLCHCANGQGHLKVLQAMDHVKTLVNENGRFDAWISTVADTMDKRGNLRSFVRASEDVRFSGIGMDALLMEYAIATLVLINMIIDTPEKDLQLRCHLRAQFVSSGIKRILATMEGFQSEHIDKQIEKFNKNEAIDYEDLLQRE